MKSHPAFRTSLSGDDRTQPLDGLCLGALLWPSEPGSSLPPGSLIKGAANFLSLPCVTCLHLDPTLETKAAAAPSWCEAAVPSTGN